MSIVSIVVGGINMFKDCFRTYETTDIKDYGKYEGLFIFEPALLPENIELKTEVKQYKYKMKSTLIDDSQYILLVCKYDEKGYQTEKERIAQIKDEYGDVIYNTELFEFPAYVYMFNEGDSSEYALVDDSTRMIYYVYVQNIFDFEDEKKLYRKVKLV